MSLAAAIRWSSLVAPAYRCPCPRQIAEDGLLLAEDALDRPDEVGDQVVAPLQLGIEIREGLVDRGVLVDEAVVRAGQDQHQHEEHPGRHEPWDQTAHPPAGGT